MIKIFRCSAAVNVQRLTWIPCFGSRRQAGRRISKTAESLSATRRSASAILRKTGSASTTGLTRIASCDTTCVDLQKKPSRRQLGSALNRHDPIQPDLFTIKAPLISRIVEDLSSALPQTLWAPTGILIPAIVGTPDKLTGTTGGCTCDIDWIAPTG